MDKEEYQKLKSNKKIQAKKSLGQNFLHSKTTLNKIIDCSNLTASDFVIEVGPGKGVLTEAILKSGAQVVCIEKDARLIDLLNEKFEDEIKSGQLKIILGDALTMEVIKKRKVFLVVDKDFTETGLRGDANIEKNIVEINKDYKIIANIPYYITGALLRIFYEQVVKPTSVTVLVQKEVADRIVARDNKESLLSLAIKFYGEPKKIMNVSKQSFKPAPKVDSAILYIKTHTIDSGKVYDLNTQGKFFDLIHRGFAHKRKVLRKNLIDSGLPTEIVDNAFTELKIAKLSRAEDINFLTWIELTSRLY
jgi:16S rRNA (adenine1518-N6/adenine1519-N6)-dimethyltransferase